MNQKTVGLTLRALIIALALILAASPGLPLLDGVAYAQLAGPTLVGNTTPANDAVSLSWNEITGATGYQVVKQDRAVGTWSAPMDVATNSYTDSAVTAGSTYGYYVRALEGTAEGTWSNYVEVAVPGGTPATPPTTVLTLTPTASGLTTINLSWTADPLADYYDLRYWDGTMWERIGGDLTTNSYSHTGLTSGARYFYIVRAVNNDGNGPWQSQPYPSEQLDATTTVPQLTLTHPERLRVELSWTRVSANAMYQVQRMKAVTRDDAAVDALSEGWANLGAAQSGNTHSDTTVTYGADDNDPATIEVVVYSYRVQAIENGIQGDPSTAKTATIPADDALPPVPPGLAAAPVSSSRINVTWSSSMGATSYQLRYKTGDGNYGNPMNMMAKMAYLHTGLSAATEYTYQVRAVNVNGHSDWASEVSASTVAATTAAGRLSVPTGLRAVDATTTADPPVPGLEVTWNPVAKATGYELRRWSGTAWAPVTLTPAEQEAREVIDDNATTGLTAGTTYYYIVAAVDDNGTDGVTTDDDMSDWSNPAMGTTTAVTPTLAPTNLLATPRGENRIWVSWTGVDGVTDYVLEWRRKGTSSWTPINVMGRTTHPHTGLSAGMQYQYRIAAKNSGGMGPWSSEESGTTWSRQLATPTALKAEDASTATTPQIMLTWKAVSGATGYEIQKWAVDETIGNAWRDLAGADGVTMAESGMTSHTDTGTGVAAGMTYYYIVRATSGAVRSPWTGAVAGMTKATAPGAPNLVLASTGQTMVRLSWAPAANTSGYTGWEIQYVEGEASGTELDNQNYQKMEMSLNAMPMHHIQRNLKPGTRYSFRVRGTLPLGVKSTFSEVGEIITKPANPTLMASSATSTSINLTWAVSAPAGLADADGGTNFDCADYEIQRRKTGESTWVNVDDDRTLTSGTCSITDDGETTDTDGLDSGTLYYYRLRVATALTDPDTHDPPTIKSYWAMANARTPSQ